MQHAHVPRADIVPGMKVGLFTVSGCALVLVAAGCSNTANEAAPPTSSSATASTSAATSSTTAEAVTTAPAALTQTEASAASTSKTTAPPAGTPNCTNAQLKLSIGPSDGAAGSTSFPITFLNSGPAACLLTGFPGVSYAYSAGSSPVGAPASRSGKTFGAVQLAPGEAATATVVATNVGNYPPEDCGPVPVAGINVYPPNTYDAVYLEHATTACTIQSAHQLSVTAVSK